MKLEDLYYFHAFLNQKLFDGKLEAVIIKRFDDSNDENDDMILGQIIENLEPFVIFIGDSLLKNDQDDPEGPIFTITVLLHEMIHQYSTENEIEDVDYYTGEHTEDFKSAAQSHGLTNNGYKMTDETRQMIERHWKLYSHLQRSVNWHSQK